MTCIYALTDPRTGETRYVGKCVTSLRRRLSGHEYKARSGRLKTPLGDWLRELQALSLRPGIVSLEETDERWQDAERRWIADQRAGGAPLLNIHAGGNGAHTRAALAPEHVALLGKVSDARIAEQAGLCRETITYHRQRAGVTASGDTSRGKGRFVKGQAAHNRVALAPEHEALFGKVPDRDVATLCGLTRHAIRLRRKALGIPPCSAPIRRRTGPRAPRQPPGLED